VGAVLCLCVCGIGVCVRLCVCVCVCVRRGGIKVWVRFCVLWVCGMGVCGGGRGGGCILIQARTELG